MLALFIKVISGLFFAYLAWDSYKKTKTIRYDVKEELLNPKTGAILRKRAIRNGLLFVILSLFSFVAILIRVAPLGE